jgi:hypothetical protein
MSLESQPWRTDKTVGLLYYSIPDADGRRCPQCVLIEYRDWIYWTPEGDETEIEWRWRDQFSSEWGGPYETHAEAIVAAGIYISDTRKEHTP